MLTTARKIEIATVVMNSRNLGLQNGICSLLLKYKEEGKELKFELIKYFNSIGLKKHDSNYWFPMFCHEARTERIEFLKKYINHLKQQENE